MARDDEWHDYYEAFDYFRAELVRDGSHPRVFEQPGATHAVVLVHGLSDSPFYMTAIAQRFVRELGYNTYLPLLHFHGLKEPRGMEGVELQEWKRNVAWSIDYALQRADNVSVGGLSTGGALAFYAATSSPKVTGALYLFPAALDLIIDRSGPRPTSVPARWAPHAAKRSMTGSRPRATVGVDRLVLRVRSGKQPFALSEPSQCQSRSPAAKVHVPHETSAQLVSRQSVDALV